MSKSLYVERVLERIGPHVLRSEVRPATDEDIERARKLHADGNCDHSVIEDEYGWMYDFRGCAICGVGLGVV